MTPPWEDLKDLGVSIVGHRRVLLHAIADLRSDTNGQSPPSEPPAAAVAAPVKDTAAERRQVTVMFFDLVGSTALSARMDPEDLRERPIRSASPTQCSALWSLARFCPVSLAFANLAHLRSATPCVWRGRTYLSR